MYQTYHRYIKDVYIPEQLQQACSSGDIARLNTYLAKYDSTPYTVIMAGCMFASLEMLGQIAAKRADVSRSVFEATCFGRDFDDVYFYHRQQYTSNKPYKSPFMWACENGRLDLAKWIWGRYRVCLHDFVSKHGTVLHSSKEHRYRTALHLACTNGHVDLVEWLLQEAGFDVSADVTADAAMPGVPSPFPTCPLDTLQLLIRQARRDEKAPTPAGDADDGDKKISKLLETALLDKFGLGMPVEEIDD